MKSKRLLTILFASCIFLFCPGTSEGQIRYIGEAPMIPVRGFIITKTGEIIHGKIAYGKFTENYMSAIKFTGQDGVKTTYNAADLAGMAISISGNYNEHQVILGNDWDIYACRPAPKKGIMVFMSRFTDGRIKVFMDRWSKIHSTGTVETSDEFDGISFSYSSDKGLTIGADYVITSGYIESRRWYSSYYVEKDGGALVKVQKDNYKTIWAELFGDCPVIAEEVGKNPDLEEFRNFLLVVEIYNQVCE